MPRSERTCRNCGKTFVPRSVRGGKRFYCYDPKCEREREKTKYRRSKRVREERRKDEQEVAEGCGCIYEMERIRESLQGKGCWTVPISKLFTSALRRAYSVGVKEATSKELNPAMNPEE